MANFTVSPSALSFSKATVRSAVSGLEPSAQVLSFTLTNNSGSDVTITDYGFTTSSEGDAVTQPSGILKYTDFTVTVHSGSFPVTVTNGSSQKFDVAYAPLRRGTGFGDVRSQLLVLFAGYKALSNGGSVFNTSGELLNDTLPQLVVVGVGGGVLETTADGTLTHPVMGMPANWTLADEDTGRHAVSAIELYSGTNNGHSQNGGVRVGARSVQVLVYGLDTASYLDLEIQAVTNSGNVSVYTWTHLTYTTIANLFLGNQKNINLQGLPLYAIVSNIHNPNNTTIKIGVVVTG